MPNSLALLGAGVKGEAKARAIGTWAGLGAPASAIGPMLRGWLVEVLTTTVCNHDWRPELGSGARHAGRAGQRGS